MRTIETSWQMKERWGDGPWQGEPDKRQWPDAATGLPCLLLRRERIGHLCGYVGVPPGHPLYGIPYDQCASIDVHGGLTFAGSCQEDERGVCHVPDAGEETDTWWLGFDCCHSGDLAPGMEATLRLIGMDHTTRYAALALPADVYRTVAYVTAECAHLAQQLVGMR